MIDREKIISALENCSDPAGKCRDCPYEECERFEKSVSEYPDELIRKAVELLKEQEPRVLSLEEVKTIGVQNYNQIRDENTRLIWSEERNALNIAKPTYYDFGLEDSEEEPIHLYYVGTDFFDTFDQNTYGKNWRCWSAKPTDEQRESVKWQD